jgi:hypothetical protein
VHEHTKGLSNNLARISVSLGSSSTAASAAPRAAGTVHSLTRC